jgi:hypothetical protein
MKTYSNIQFPKAPIKWKGDEMAVFANHAYEGKSEEGDDIYSADLTVSKGAELEAIMQAFTRQVNDKALDDAVIYNFEIDGVKAIDKEFSQSQQAPTNIFPALPDTGRLVEGEIYSYGNGAVKVRQTHDRTVYSPEETPALFTFYREVTEGQLWIPDEEVNIGDTREYDGVMYECIQSHVTQEDWTPPATPALWQVYEEPSADYPVWKRPTGTHDAYKIGDVVWYPAENTQLYRSKIDGNATVPDGDEPYNRYWEEYTP